MKKRTVMMAQTRQTVVSLDISHSFLYIIRPTFTTLTSECNLDDILFDYLKQQANNKCTKITEGYVDKKSDWFPLWSSFIY
jgi:hypothetical protein